MLRRPIVIATMFLAMLLAGCGDDDPVKPDRWRLLGDITSAETGRPIPKVEVTLDEEVTQTGSDGHYFFTDLKTGTYELTATVDGYQPYSATIEINQSLRHDIAMELRRPN